MKSIISILFLAILINSYAITAHSIALDGHEFIQKSELVKKSTITLNNETNNNDNHSKNIPQILSRNKRSDACAITFAQCIAAGGVLGSVLSGFGTFLGVSIGSAKCILPVAAAAAAAAGGGGGGTEATEACAWRR